MSVEPSEPRRRKADARPAKPALIAPTPGPGQVVPHEVRRSIELALERARRGRRHVTLVSLGMPQEAEHEAFVAVATAVRRTIRGGDGLWRDGHRSLAILLADVDAPSVEPALTRLRAALEPFAGQGLDVGRASPPPGLPASELLELARAGRVPLRDDR